MLNYTEIDPTQLKESSGFSFLLSSTAELEKLLNKIQNLGLNHDDLQFSISLSKMNYMDIVELKKRLKGLKKL